MAILEYKLQQNVMQTTTNTQYGTVTYNPLKVTALLLDIVTWASILILSFSKSKKENKREQPHTLQVLS